MKSQLNSLVFRTLVDNALTKTREEIAQMTGYSPHSLKKYESRMRGYPDFPRSCCTYCPRCERKVAWHERHQKKTSISPYCKACYLVLFPYKDPARKEETEQWRAGNRDPLKKDPALWSPRLKMKHQVEWRHGYVGRESS